MAPKRLKAQAEKGHKDKEEDIAKQKRYIMNLSALRCYARTGDRQRMNELLSGGLPANVPDEVEQMPLHYVAQGGDVDCARLLLESQAPIEARNAVGQTAL